MAVRIPGPDDINASQARNERGVVNIQADPIGQVFENLGERGRQIAGHLHEQQTEGDVLRADLAARQELDALRRKVETGADPTQYETQFQQGAQQILTARGQGMSRDAQALWERRSAELLTDGVLTAREGAQRRMLSDTTASIRRTQEEADRIIQDPESDEATRDRALETVRLSTSKAQERGLLSPDAAAQFVTATEGRLAEVRRTIGLTAAAQTATDAIFAGNETFDDRLAAARAITNPALRERVEDEVVQRQSRDNAARGELLDQAYAHIAAGERVPQELFRQLSGRDQVTLQDYIRERSRSIAAGAEIPRDRALISDLSVEAISNPRVFSRRDLQEVRGRLGEEAYQRLATAQAAMRRGEERAGVTREQAAGAMTMATRQLRAAGYDTSASANTDDQEQVAAFQEDLIGRLDRFYDENDRAPNATEQMTIIQDLLSTRLVNSGGAFGWGRSEGRLTDFYVPYAQMSEDEVARATAAARQQGLEPTRGNIERVFANARLAAARRENSFDRESPRPQ